MLSLLVKWTRKHFIMQSKQFLIVTFVVIIIAVLYLIVFNNLGSLASSFIMTILAMAWSAWIVIAILRGSDEVKSVATRFGLAFGGGIGIPVAILFVMVMLALPNVAEFIESAAALSKNSLPPAAVGFGLGVSFTALIVSFFFVVGTSVWWLLRR